MCPALVLGFGAIIMFGMQTGGQIAYTVSIAARFIFCPITQIYFARYALLGVATPVRSYGLGWIFVHLGDLLGVVAISAISAGTAAGVFAVDQAMSACIVALVGVVMLVLNDRKTFSGETRESKHACEHAPDGAVAAGRVGSTHSVAGLEAGAAEPSTDGVDATSDPAADDIDARIRELARAAALTPRETEVFDLLARGRSIPYMRDALVISKETAATHAKHIYAKLGVHSRQELIDLVTPPAGLSV